jgi:transposase
MSARFVNVDRRTPMLLPPDLREWIEEDDPVHFIIEAVERLPLTSFRVNHRGTGEEQFPPHMMMALLVYCYVQGIFSSRKIERATWRDVAVRYLTADHHPDHDTICKFRRENLDAFRESFLDVLELARELQLLKLGKVSLDGAHYKANASIDQNVTYSRAVEIRERLRADIDELLARAEAEDTQAEEAEKLPGELARREKLAAKMDRAIEELEKRARQRQAEADKEFEAKLEARRRKQEETGKKPTGREPKKPEVKPEDSGEQCNLTDPDARIMRKNKRAGFTQSYNAQAVVDAEGSQLIVGQRISQNAGDGGELVAGVDCVPPSLGRPTGVLADAGYADGDGFDELGERGVEVWCSVHREDAHAERYYDFRPKAQVERKPREPKDPRLVAMRDKLRTEEGKAIYRKRCHTVEPVFGIIKSAIGFRGFSLRGKEKVEGEWTLVCLAYNLKRMWNLIKPANKPVKPHRERPVAGCGAAPGSIPALQRVIWPFCRALAGRNRRAVDLALRTLPAQAVFLPSALLALTPTGS